MKQLKVKKVHPEAIIPTRSHKFDAGLDLYALEDNFVPIRGIAKVSTGVGIEIPEGYYAQIQDRSGMAVKGLRTGAGVIDHGYRAELVVVLHNLSYDKDLNFAQGMYGYNIKKGDRIAQLILHKVEFPEVVEVTEFEDSERGENGFNSTGR